MVGANKLIKLNEWVTEGKGEIVVVFDVSARYSRGV